MDSAWPKPSSPPGRAAPGGRPEGGGLGRCPLAFCLAVALDVVGASVLLAGSFANVFFADLLVHIGVFCVFFSLVWWVCWYVANLVEPPAEPQGAVDEGRPDAVKEDPAGAGGRGLRRAICRRISATFFPGRPVSIKETTVTVELENA